MLKTSNLNINLIDKCSGHGGSFGVKKNTYPWPKNMEKWHQGKFFSEDTVIVSECPLAAQHLCEVNA